MKSQLHIYKNWLSISSLSLCCLALSSCKTVEPYIATAMDVAQQVSNTSGAPSYNETAQAIKQALEKGAGTAVNSLGNNGGFSQSSYKILMPQELQNIASTARKIGFGSQIDQFESSMNKAAEKAVPIALNNFKQAISQMSIQDAIGIMRGADNAATQYFAKTSSDKIKQEFLPIIKKVTSQTGVTEQYKQLAPKLNMASQMLGKGNVAVDIDQYITNEANKALFSEIAKQEKMIRDNPAQRTTELLQKVFQFYAK